MRVRAFTTVLVSASFVMSAASAEPTTPAAKRWVVRDLGARFDLGSGDGSLIVYRDASINARGLVAGTEDDGRRTRAFVWVAGRLTRLGLPWGDTDSEFVGLNDRGQVVGASFKGSRSKNAHAFLWDKGRMRRLGSFWPADINEHGQVAGTIRRGRFRAVLWTRGRVRYLGTSPDGRASEAAALNDAGQVVGMTGAPINDGSPDPSTGVTFLWQNGKMRTLGAVPGRTGSTPVDINERGQIVGTLSYGGYIWQRGKMSAIQKGSAWQPTAINDRGQVALNYANEWILWYRGKIRHRGTGEITSLDERGKVTIADYGRTIPRLWANRTTTRLPLLAGDDGGAALALNERDQVVGVSCKLEGDYTGPIADYVWHCHVVRWTLTG